ncbi:succinyldiaminopimelate transaminase [Teredinibacter purpureus]|uniref:succinyldiaminopimelate transaminase n=1 Tax=Teredinibacter purpureus TaxID=2731756 RepID=UPI0005F82808|nr:succinyldiaminopimelate transaminase [Teredinibacter purpureus]
MNPLLQQLHPYPFEKLGALKTNITPPPALEHIALSIGEPKHEPPAHVLNRLSEQLSKVAHYPSTKGLPELRSAMAAWASKRFNLTNGSLSPDDNILPVNGTREALFAFVQASINSNSLQKPKVLMPNPFYQIYEGAALLAGAEPVFLNCTPENGFQPDYSLIDDDTWRDCQLLFICTPGNPTGAVMSIEQLQALIQLADEHDFIIASDECYSELYFDEANPPAGLLQACANMARDNFERCIVFHSLSKRSNLPGLRSGFVAGDKNLLAPFFQYRTYHGSAMPVHTQLASIAAWQDEAHVKSNRDLYRKKFECVLRILGDSLRVERPEASFYLWAETPIADTEFAQRLFAEYNITVLPGSYLARDTENGNPGKNRIRMALVASLEECEQAAIRIRDFCQQL